MRIIQHKRDDDKFKFVGKLVGHDTRINGHIGKKRIYVKGVKRLRSSCFGFLVLRSMSYLPEEFNSKHSGRTTLSWSRLF